MQHLNYWQLPGFEHIYLEDSYVLGIEHKKASEHKTASLTILVEAVLTENHPLYSQPLSGERYCYRRMKIKFANLQDCHLSPHNMNSQDIRSIPNPDGTIDWGNIDQFYLANGQYHLLGEWGKITLVSDPPELGLDSILVRNGDRLIHIDKDKIEAVEWKSEGVMTLIHRDDSGNPLFTHIDINQDPAAFAAAEAYKGELEGGFITEVTGITELTGSKL